MPKIVSIHQPAYMPWLGWWHKLLLSDVFIILDTVQFEKNSFINRNRILQPDGRPLWLTVPVLTKGHMDKTIEELLVDPSKDNWPKKHWKSIEQCYSKTPYWKHPVEDSTYKDVMLKLYELAYTMNYTLFYDHFAFSLIFVMSLLGLRDKKWERASDYGKTGKKGSNLVLELCKHEDANIYISGAQGKNYLDEASFAAEGIKVVYQDYRHPQYDQRPQGGFVSHMSVLDLLFNCGPDSTKVIMEGNVTREDLHGEYPSGGGSPRR